MTPELNSGAEFSTFIFHVIDAPVMGDGDLVGIPESVTVKFMNRRFSELIVTGYGGGDFSTGGETVEFTRSYYASGGENLIPSWAKKLTDYQTCCDICGESY